MQTDIYMPLVQQKLQDEFALELHVDKLDFVNHLALEIDRLIVGNFPKLVQILYRLDIDETHLKDMLDKYVYEDAGYIIAQLIIDRELQKARSRAENTPQDDKKDGEDRW